MSPTLPIVQATILHAPEAEAIVRKAAQVLREEIAVRTRRNLPIAERDETPGSVIALGTVAQPAAVAARFAQAAAGVEHASPDAYRIWARTEGEEVTIGILGNSPRAVLFGVGRLLRRMELTRETLAVPTDLELSAAPEYPLVGHQLGYRDKTNSYCAWDVAQYDQYIRELALFGTNAIELIPPGTDDLDDSVHFPIPHLDMIREQSRICTEYGLDVWLWFPVMRQDYTDPAQVEEELDFWHTVLTVLPHLDHVFVPGGDPGHTPAPVLMELLARQAAQLDAIHPGAKIWISPQGFSSDDLQYLLDYLETRAPDWVGGLVHGPWVNIPMSEFRAMVPAAYPIRNYPDITHTLSAQFPVPEWDVALAMTVGREPVNPRPVDAEHCFGCSQPGTIGMLSYSEGCNDDVNKMIWSTLSWNDQKDVFGTLEEYARFFVRPDLANDFAHGLLALERNWRGPLAINRGVQTTLRQFQAMERSASPFLLRNWRFQQALYRAHYDAYIQTRLLYETGLEVQALDRLRQASRAGARVAVREALNLWNQAVLSPVASDLKTRIFQLAEALFHSVRMQLSVALYKAQYETRGANLDALDFPLNDRIWWREHLTEVLRLDTEEERLARIAALLARADATPGGFHDDLVRPHDLSRVVGRRPYAEDPGGLASPTRRYLYRKTVTDLPLAWRGALVTLGAHPMRMRYENLEQDATYELRIAYGGQSRARVRLETEEGVLIHGLMPTWQKAELQVFDVPREAIRDGVLNLVWRPEENMGSSGVVCDISEILLCKTRWTV